MSSLSLPASGIAGHRAMAAIEARRMARHPVFVLGVALGFVVLGLYVVLVEDETGVPVVLTLPLLGAFYIGLTSVIAAALLTRSTEVAVEAVATAPGTEARRTLALAATGIPPLVAGLVFSVALVALANVIGVAPQEWWFGTLPDWQVWSIVLICPVACLDGALLAGRWLRFRGASAVVVVALIVVSLLGQTPLLETGSSEWRLWVPWAIFHTGDNPDGSQTLIAGNPAAYLGYLLALGALAVLGAMWHDHTARTPRFRILVAAVAATAVALFVLAATTSAHDNRDSDPIPSRVTG
jgi:predicted outer membrane lipoprotein